MEHTYLNPSIRLFDPPPHDEPFNPGQRDDVLRDIADLEGVVRVNVDILVDDIGWDTSIQWTPASLRPGVTENILTSDVWFTPYPLALALTQPMVEQLQPRTQRWLRVRINSRVSHSS
jgi:hypothetical protein